MELPYEPLANVPTRWVSMLLIVAAALIAARRRFVQRFAGASAAWAVCLFLALVGWGVSSSGCCSATEYPQAGLCAPCGALRRRPRAGWSTRRLAPCLSSLCSSAQVIVGRSSRPTSLPCGGKNSRRRRAPRPRSPRTGVRPARSRHVRLRDCPLLGYLGLNVFQPSDDLPAYFLVSRKAAPDGQHLRAIQRSKADDLRRPVVPARAVLTVAPHGVLHVVDGGLGFAIVAGLLTGRLVGAARLASTSSAHGSPSRSWSRCRPSPARTRRA